MYLFIRVSTQRHLLACMVEPAFTHNYNNLRYDNMPKSVPRAPKSHKLHSFSSFFFLFPCKITKFFLISHRIKMKTF